MVKFFALLLAAIGFLMLGLGLALMHEHPAMLALGVAGAAITYFAYSMNRGREKSLIAQHDKEIVRRSEALAKTPWENGKSLEVRTGSAKFLIALLMLAASVLFAYSSASATEPRWGVFVGSVLFSAVVLFSVVRLLPGMAKPALVLSNRGFQTPLHGTVPWREVDGINLQQIALRGSTTNTLNFRVENYAEGADCIHWTERLLAVFGLGVLKRKVVVVLLNGASEKPETVYAIARFLWQQNTGMNHEWNPMFSNEFNQAARRVHEFRNRYKDPDASAAGLLSEPDKALKELEQFRQDMDTVNSERRRTISKINWMVALSILGIVATFLWPVVKRHI
ncbi:hypothetical protein [Dechloromonas sp. A34]|uniref:hypothetical protein n=1 Tax=Dechloromonas sp. A34 TaxID=447588 RepID=UPI002248C0AF|nr:hypothetical protein [Dechloromonas sp. A34]